MSEESCNQLRCCICKQEVNGIQASGYWYGVLAHMACVFKKIRSQT